MPQNSEPISRIRGKTTLRKSTREKTLAKNEPPGELLQLRRHVEAPESFVNMSVTDLALGIDPRKHPLTEISASHPTLLTPRMEKIAEVEMKRDVRRNQEYLLHQLKRNDVFVRRPAETDNHITRATRLIEAERMTLEVDEALRSVKDGFAAEMDRCGKRKNDSIRKTAALIEAMYNFSDFVATNDHWINHNTEKSQEDERLVEIYTKERNRLLDEQKNGLQRRLELRSQYRARKKYKEFLDEILLKTSGDFNGPEHLITELEQQASMIALAKEAENEKLQLQVEAKSFRARLSTAMAAQLAQIGEKEKQLQEAKIQLNDKLTRHAETQQRIDAQEKADVEEYLNLRSAVYEIYSMANTLLGHSETVARGDLTEQLRVIAQCFLDSYIVQTAVTYVFANTPRRKGKESLNQRLNEVSGLVGSGFFPHLTFKIELKPSPIVAPLKETRVETLTVPS